MDNTQFKHIMQIVDAKTGQRSDPFHCTLDEMKDALMKNPIDDGQLDDYILLVAVTKDDDWEIPRSPLIRVGTFIGMYDQEKANNG